MAKLRRTRERRTGSWQRRLLLGNDCRYPSPTESDPGLSVTLPERLVMSATPRVSYVVLSRNSAAYIERCLGSLDVQNVLPGGDEIWVVDNGSTDGTGEVLARFAGTRPWVH